MTRKGWLAAPGLAARFRAWRRVLEDRPSHGPPEASQYLPADHHHQVKTSPGFKKRKLTAQRSLSSGLAFCQKPPHLKTPTTPPRAEPHHYQTQGPSQSNSTRSLNTSRIHVGKGRQGHAPTKPAKRMAS